MRFATKAIHSGGAPDPLTGAVIPPIYLSTTYQQEAPGKHKGYEYSRTKNPTRDQLEACITALEEGEETACFASGLSATSAIMQTLSPGDGVVAGCDLYGGTVRLLDKVYKLWGIKVVYAESNDLTDFESKLKSLDKPKLVWIESPTNPLLNIVDISTLSQLTHSYGAKLVVDNTFATPYLQNPLKLGADYVVHSSTKYLGGHSDVVGGAVTVKNKEDVKSIRFLQNAVGGVPSPFDCYLLLRGIKTLHIRVERQCKNAEEIVSFLINHPKIKKVYYPTLTAERALVNEQMRHPGAMVSFEVDSIETVNKMCERLKIIALAESLGAVESLLCVPYYMTHASLPEERKKRLNITPTLIRLSVGIEDINDLLSELDSALQ
ncbi:MAG: PLP-dependent aspartate aminotransferase family protein [Candidatus Hydrogenedentes bacterium]|nr:PLP-dependent aspartate aminotransferase family protein [Candidatus Hydrogenedentota bacterium]